MYAINDLWHRINIHNHRTLDTTNQHHHKCQSNWYLVLYYYMVDHGVSDVIVISAQYPSSLMDKLIGRVWRRLRLYIYIYVHSATPCMVGWSCDLSKDIWRPGQTHWPVELVRRCCVCLKCEMYPKCKALYAHTHKNTHSTSYMICKHRVTDVFQTVVDGGRGQTE